jgi:hypothetical protein
MSKPEKPITVTRDVSEDRAATSVMMTAEMRESWDKAAEELYDWLKARFDQPLEAFAFVHFALQTWEEAHEVKYTGSHQYDDQEA